MGETVSLRRIDEADWPIVHTWGQLLEFCRFQPWGPDTPEDSRTFVAAAAAAWSEQPQTRYAYLACLDGRPIGTGELRLRNVQHRQGEIAYGLHPEEWGQGYGTAIGNELLRIGFQQMGLHRIYGTCDPRNLGSAAVLKKLGMIYEGRQRHTLLIRDGWRDSEYFSIIEHEWRAHNHGQMA
jgi:[ribosomal protein S5]-alanine N-acetyltransferase